jgi:hypothetical protein
VDPFLKQAYEEGQRQAEEDTSKQLKDAIKKREALVGWKEQARPPERLSHLPK